MPSRLTRLTAAIVFVTTLGVSARAQGSDAGGMAGGRADSVAVDVLAGALPDPMTLPDALTLARRFNADLRVAMSSLAVARADSEYARLPSFNPELELRTSRGGSSLGSGSEGTLEVGVSQEMELWGKRGARQSVATARVATGTAEWYAAAQKVESEIRTGFERSLYLQERLETLNTLTDLDRQVALASQARVRDGSITPLTGRLTDLDLLRLVAQVRGARAEYRQALVALGLAIGIQLPDSISLGGVLEADSLRAPEDSVIALAFRLRSDGDVLRRRMDERRAELHLAQREGRPNLTLGAGLARDRLLFSHDDFFGDPAIVGGIGGARSTDKLWSLRVSAPLPLWQRNQRGRAVAAAEMARSQAEYDRYRLGLRLDVVAGVRRFQDAAGLYRLYLDRSDRVRQDLALVRDAYKDGRIPLDSYLTQKGRLVDTLNGELEAAADYWEARGDLETLVGVGLDRINDGSAR